MESISGNAHIIKEININFVRKIMKIKGQTTAQEITLETGMSLVTVGTILQQLLMQNEIFTTELSLSSGGRPAQQYSYNYNLTYVLILFPYEAEGRIIIHSSVANLSSHCVYESDVVVESIDLKSFERIIEPLLTTYPNIQVIGFGHAGIVDSGKIILSAYKMLLGTSLIEHFRTLYKVPVIIENDVNAALIGFAKRRKLMPDCTVIYIYFPDQYPPGAGIIINGELLKGRGNFAGEVNRIPLDIRWGKKLYSSFDLMCDSVAKLIVAVCSILNPDMVVLNGNFLIEAHIVTITEKCNTMLPQNFIPEMYLTDNFVSDYQSGLIAQTLEQLEPNIKLSRKKQIGEV